LCQRDVAASGDQFCRIQCIPVFSFLRLLLEFTRLAESREFGLLGLIEQIIRFAQAAGVECCFRRTCQISRVRIVRLKSRQFVLRLGEMGRYLDQPCRDFLFRYILLAEDFEKLGDCSCSEPQLRGELRRLGFGLTPMLFRNVLVVKRLGQQSQCGRIFLIYRVVDRAVANRSADANTLGRSNPVARSPDRLQRYGRDQGDSDKKHRPKWSDYFVGLVTHGPAVAVPPETLLLIFDPPLTLPPIAIP
jgi:hypothetical protein